MNQGQGPSYVRSSSLKKTLHYETQQDPQTGKPIKQPQELDQDVTEELSITLTAPKANDLINQIDAAMKDQEGTGGVRITLYCKRILNPNTNELFDGANILIKPQRPGNRGGGFQRRGSFRGGGRRQYPPRQSPPGPSPRASAPQVGGYTSRTPVQQPAPPPQRVVQPVAPQDDTPEGEEGAPF